MKRYIPNKKRKILIIDPPMDNHIMNVFIDLEKELEKYGFELFFLFWNNAGKFIKYTFYFNNVIFREIDIKKEKSELINNINCEDQDDSVRGVLELYIEVIISDVEPCSFGLWNGNRLSNKVFSKIALMNNISVSYFEQGVFPDSLSIDPKGTNGGSLFSTNAIWIC